MTTWGKDCDGHGGYDYDNDHDQLIMIDNATNLTPTQVFIIIIHVVCVFEFHTKLVFRAGHKLNVDEWRRMWMLQKCKY